MDDQELEVRRTPTFERWFERLKDQPVKGLILERIYHLQKGHKGDTGFVGDGVFELRIAFGPGYRLYGMYSGRAVVLLLCGGDKGSQRRDIARAKRMARRLRNEEDICSGR